MELLRLINSSELIAQVLSFLLLVFLLRRFLWKRVLTVLDNRKDTVAAEYRRIEETKAELSSVKADYDRRLAGIEDAAQRKIQEAVAEGRSITDQLRKKAHQEAQGIINSARENVRYELVKAKESIRDEIIDLSIKTAEHVIQEKLTEEDDRRLVKDFLRQLDNPS